MVLATSVETLEAGGVVVVLGGAGAIPRVIRGVADGTSRVSASSAASAGDGDAFALVERVRAVPRVVAE